MGSVLTPHDCITNVQKRLGNRIWVGGGRCRCCGFFLDPTAGTRRNLQQRRSHAGAPRVCSCCCLRHGTGRPWHYHGTQGALTASQARRADSLTAVAVSGRSAALDVCVASSTAAPRGDAAQAALDRKLSHYRNEIGELRHRGILYRPLVWTADVRPHPAVTRTLQYAADIASSQSGQHLSAKSLHRVWKHEIQIALLRRKAGMARAVHPNPSARAEWLLAGIIDRALNHWGHVPALDGGLGDHDLDTAIPDDDDDIVSLARYTHESV